MKKQIIQQIYEIIPNGSRVIDLGSGTGELLSQLSDKIDYGFGIEINPKKVCYAQRRIKNQSNINFEIEDFFKMKQNDYFDYSIASFVIHSLDYRKQVDLLNLMQNISTNILIADIVSSDSFFLNILINMDELISGHYKNFKKYSKKGIEYLIKESNLQEYKRINGLSKFYNLYMCK